MKSAWLECLFLLLPALVAFVIATPAHSAGPVEDLLARHLDWLGGKEAHERLQVISMTGRLEIAGLSGTIRAVQHRDGRMRSEFDLGVIKGAQGISDRGWVLNASGQLEPLAAEEEKRARREIARTFGDSFRGADGSQAQDLGVEEKDGRMWAVVRFLYPDGDAWDLFLDETDGSQTWAREQRDTEVIWHRMEDWRMVDGIRVPFVMRDLHRNADQDQVLTVESIRFNEPVTADAFDPPAAGRKIYRIDGDAASTDWIPMALHRGAYIYLRGTVNGMDTEILLDSGAGMSVLDQSFAELLGITGAGSIAAQGTSGETTASLARQVQIRIGQLELTDMTAAVIDLSGVTARLGRQIPCILGKELFHALVVDVDYPGQRLRFVQSDGYAYDGPGHRLPVYPTQDGHKEVDVRVEDLPPARVALDTGSGAALDLYKFYAEENRILEGRPRLSEALAGGVGGMSVQTLTSLDSLEIAGFVLRDVPIGVPQTEVGAFHTKRAAGNLGAGVLKRFRVVFDYARECLWLEPGPAGSSFDRNRSGLQLQRKDDTLEVVFVAPGSPARDAGWQTGDRIVAVDGVTVGTTYTDAIDRFGNRPEGSVVRLTLADGTERSLTLSRYY